MPVYELCRMFSFCGWIRRFSCLESARESAKKQTASPRRRFARPPLSHARLRWGPRMGGVACAGLFGSNRKALGNVSRQLDFGAAPRRKASRFGPGCRRRPSPSRPPAAPDAIIDCTVEYGCQMSPNHRLRFASCNAWLVFQPNG
jgi:hypothetical protein